jgi:hypothetical protein
MARSFFLPSNPAADKGNRSREILLIRLKAPRRISITFDQKLLEVGKTREMKLGHDAG